MDSLATVAEVSEIPDHAISTALEKLDESVTDMARPTIINTLENCDSESNKMFARRVFQNVLRDVLASILENDTGIRDVFEAVVAHIVRARNLAKETANLLDSETVEPAPSGTYVAKMNSRAVSQALT